MLEKRRILFWVALLLTVVTLVHCGGSSTDSGGEGGSPVETHPNGTPVDVEPPTQTTLPAAGSVVSTLAQVDVVFSEVVSGGALLANYNLTGSGVGSLALTGVTEIAERTYRITLSGTPGNGNIQINISGITDAAGIALSGTQVNYTGDIVNPTQSASPVSGSGLNAVNFIDITYSEAVVGAATSSNYVVGGVGAGTLSATNATDQGSDVYRVTLIGTPTNGAFTLTINNVTDAAGSALSGNVISYTFDVDAPTQSTNPASGSTLSSLPQIDVTFSEPVVGGGTIGNYSLSGAGTGSLAINTLTPMGGNVYRLAFTGTPGNGLVQLTISNVTDNVGNILSANTSSYTLDLANPTQTTNPAGGSKVATLAQVDVTYSEVVLGAANFTNYVVGGAGQGTLSVISATDQGSNVYRLSLSGSPGNGAITITISNVTDVLANALSGNVINYTGDVAAPTKSALPATASTVNSLAQVDVTYSEAVVGAATLGNYALSGAGVGSLSITNATLQTGDTYRLTLTGTPGNGAIQLAISNVTDTAGNALSGTMLDYTGDIDAPTQSANPAHGTLLTTLTQVDITYSEPAIGGLTSGNYVLSGSGQGTLAVTGVTDQGSNVYRVSFSGSPTNGNIIITINNVSDAAGNALVGNIIKYEKGTPYNQARQKSAHNAYQRGEAILDQLVYHRIRSFELDIWKDKLGHSTTSGNWFVYHTPIIDTGTTCHRLSDCFDEITAFHSANPNHEVLTVWIDLKGNFSGGGHNPSDLDTRILTHLPSSAIYKPQDLIDDCTAIQGSAPASLQAAVTAPCRWPLLSNLKGKVIFGYTGGDVSSGSSKLNTYVGGGPTGPNAESMVGFIAPQIDSAGEYTTITSTNDYVVFFNMNNPQVSLASTVYSGGYVGRVYGVNSSGAWSTASSNNAHHIGTDKVNFHQDVWATTHNATTGWPFQCMTACTEGVEANNTIGIDVDSEDIWNSSDNFHFRYETLVDFSSDRTLMGAVNSANSNLDMWAKGCVMARLNTTVGSPYFATCRPADNERIRVQYRTTQGGSSSAVEHNIVPSDTIDYESITYVSVVLDNSGTRARGYGSQDGANWVLITTVSFGSALPLFGLGASSHGNTPVKFLFTNVYRDWNLAAPYTAASLPSGASIGTVRAANVFDGIFP